MKMLTKNQMARIEKNLKAYLSNFTPIKIIKVNNYFLIYDLKEYEQKNHSNYLYSAENIDHLNGFLYGMVKGKYSKNLQIEVDFNINNDDILKVFEL
jgi:hypothetical protein